MLAAAVIFGMVAAGLYLVLGQPIRALERAKQVVQQDRELRAIHTRMERDFAAAVVRSPFTPFSFKGDRRTVRFISLVGDQESPFQELRYEWTQSVTQGALTGQWLRYVREVDPVALGGSIGEAVSSAAWNGGQAVVLMRAREVALEYFDAERKLWVSYWDSDERRGLPAAVRMNLTVGEPVGQQPMALVFPIFPGRTYRPGNPR